MTSLVIFGWVYQRTSSSFAVGLGILAHRLPMSLGAWAFSKQAEARPDRWRIICDLIRFFILLIIVLLTRFEPFSTLLNIAVFLFLASLRSFFSGTDAAVEAKLISIHSSTQDHAARNQLVISYLLGLNGFIASVLFCLGLLRFSYTAVLIFDALTFLISALAINGLIKKQNDFKMLRVNQQEGSFVAFKAQPKVWFPLLIHIIRNLCMSVVMQEALLLYKVKFQGGEESSGYLYMALTLGWFLSSKMRSRFYMASTPISLFYIISLVVCLLTPVVWTLSSAMFIFCLVFVISFCDGFASSSLSAFLHQNVKRDFLARTFSFQSITSNLIVVVGSLVIGILSEKFGYFHASIYMCVICAFGLLIVTAWLTAFGNAHIFFYNKSLIKKLTDHLEVEVSTKDHLNKLKGKHIDKSL